MPTVFITNRDGMEIMHLPQAKHFSSDPTWPKELADLYEEASKSYSAGAYTSASMVCRKLLMSCACHEQQKTTNQPPDEGKSFAHYVDYLATSVLNFAQAKSAIDAIRQIGNEANHHVAFVTQPDAERSMKIVWYLLNTLYALPAA